MATEPSLPASPPPAAPLPTSADALRALGRRFSDAADAYNARLQLEAPHLSAAEVFPLLQDEMLLRQAANRMFFEAAQITIDEAATDLAELGAAVGTAEKAFKKLADLRAVLDLVADLLVLASSVLAAKPGPIVAALKEVKQDLDAVG